MTTAYRMDVLAVFTVIICLATQTAIGQRHICLGNDINPCDAPASTLPINESELLPETTITLEQELPGELIGSVPLPPGITSERDLFGSYCGGACGNNRCDDELADCLISLQLGCGIESGIPFCDECTSCPMDCPQSQCLTTTSTTSTTPPTTTSSTPSASNVSESTVSASSSLPYREYLPPNYSESDWRRRLAAENAKTGWESLLEAFGIREPEPLPGQEAPPESDGNTLTYLFALVGVVVVAYGIAVYLRRM